MGCGRLDHAPCHHGPEEGLLNPIGIGGDENKDILYITNADLENNCPGYLSAYDIRGLNYLSHLALPGFPGEVFSFKGHIYVSFRPNNPDEDPRGGVVVAQWSEGQEHLVQEEIVYFDEYSFPFWLEVGSIGCEHITSEGHHWFEFCGEGIQGEEESEIDLLLAADASSGRMGVIDLTKGPAKLIKEIDLKGEVGNKTRLGDVRADEEAFAWVVDRGNKELLVLDLKTLHQVELEERIEIGGAPVGMAMDAARKLAYVSDESRPAIRVIDLDARTPLDMDRSEEGIQGISLKEGEGTYSLALSSEGGRLIGVDRKGGRMYLFDISSLSDLVYLLRTTWDMTGSPNPIPLDMFIKHDPEKGLFLYKEEADSIPLGKLPNGIFTRDNFAYITNFLSNDLSVIDLSAAPPEVIKIPE